MMGPGRFGGLLNQESIKPRALAKLLLALADISSSTGI